MTEALPLVVRGLVKTFPGPDGTPFAAVDHLDGEIGGLGALPGQRRGGGFGRFVGGLFRCGGGFTLPFHLVGVPQCDADHCDQGQQDDEHPVVRFLTCHISEMLYS